APAGRAVGDDRDLLDNAALPDALDLRAAFRDRAGDREFVYQPVGNHFGVVRLLLHVMIIVVSFADLRENPLLLFIEHVRLRMRAAARLVRLARVFGGRFARYGARPPEDEMNVAQLSPRRFRAGLDARLRLRQILVGDADEHDDAVGDFSGELQHLRTARRDVDRHAFLRRMLEMNLARRKPDFFAGDQLAHLADRPLEVIEL